MLVRAPPSVLPTAAGQSITYYWRLQPDVAGVTFSASAPVPKFLNPDPGLKILRI